MKANLPKLVAKAKAGERLVMVTAYDAAFGRLIDQTDVDLILVGDSLGMVVQGHETTLPVTLDQVIYHTSCVSRVVTSKPIIADLPFMSYQASRAQALLAAGRALKEGGAHGVKIEGGREIAETVEAMVEAGIPVMGHIGLQPQRIHAMGGYKIQGKRADQEMRLLEDAKQLEAAGAFSIVLEGIVMESAAAITQALSIPTIGIASGPDCNGQVLVIHDLLGLTPGWNPRFAKRYANLHELITQAVESYAQEVREGRFPTEEHATRRETSPEKKQ